MIRVFFIGLSAVLLSCSDKEGEDTGRVEGQLAGDCSDGADNDLDGYFDCNDAGCDGSSDCASGSDGGGPGGSSDGPPPEETTIESAAWGCTETNYFFDVYTAGLATGGLRKIYQTGASGPWDEQHPITVLESDPAFYWSRLYLDLDSVYPVTVDVVAGSTTLYNCDSNGLQYTLTFVIEVSAPDGPENADCVVWGHNPDGAPADSCDRITAGSATQLR